MQADLSPSWVHMTKGVFSDVAAHLILNTSYCAHIQISSYCMKQLWMSFCGQILTARSETAVSEPLSC